MRILLALMVAATLAGCGSKKPAAKNPSNTTTEHKESEEHEEKNTNSHDDADDAKDMKSSDPCEGGE